jgi:LEA14-like dessication related protein
LEGENGMQGRWNLGVAALFCGGLAGCASLSPALDPPQVEVVRLESEWASPEHTSYQVEIKVQNGNPMTLLLAQLDVTLTDGKQIARQSQSTQMPMVPAYTERTLMATLRLPNQASDVATKRRFTISGKLQTASQWQPTPLLFRQEFDRSVPLLPKATVTKVRTIRSQRKQLLLLSLANPNPFAVSLHRIRAEVDLDGQAYPLRPMENELAVASGQTVVLSLAMEGLVLTPQNKGKAAVSGEMEFASPAGRLLIPMPAALP